MVPQEFAKVPVSIAFQRRPSEFASLPRGRNKKFLGEKAQVVGS
jgi:hypothetical protein